MKAQAAMEYLMTYGWVFLVIIAVVAALYAMGVFGRLFPSTCMLEPGLACTDFKVTSQGAVLMVKNGLGRDITVKAIRLPEAADCSRVFNIQLPTGEQKRFDMECDLSKWGRFKSDIELTYEVGGLKHNATGSIVSLVSKIGDVEELSDGSEEKNLTFETSGDQTDYLKIPKNADVLKATIDLSGLDDGSGNYPSGVTLDIGDDGDIDWEPESIEPGFSRDCSRFLAPFDDPIHPQLERLDYVKVHWRTNFSKSFTLRNLGFYLYESVGNPLSLNLTSNFSICEFSRIEEVGGNPRCESDRAFLKENLSLDWTGWKHFDVNDFYIEAGKGYQFNLDNVSGDGPILNNRFGSKYPQSPGSINWEMWYDGGAGDIFGGEGYTISIYNNYFFDTTETIPDISLELNEYLSICTADFWGNCLVPLALHSDSTGLIQISNINIYYTVK